MPEFDYELAITIIDGTNRGKGTITLNEAYLDTFGYKFATACRVMFVIKNDITALSMYGVDGDRDRENELKEQINILTKLAAEHKISNFNPQTLIKLIDDRRAKL